MTFASPIFLWLLLPAIPALIAFFIWAWRSREQAMQKFISARLLMQLTAGFSQRLHILRLILLGSAVLATLIALARPQWGMNWSEAKQRGLDILIAIDTSRSMLATDVQPNRLARAKLEALGLMSKAHSDRLGIVAFAGGAFLQCPLTLDDEAFRQSLAALDTDIIPQGGTALAEAIQTAMVAFKEAGENLKVLVIFTDGEDHEEGALDIAKEAAKAGVRIFTIGVGSTEGEMIRVPEPGGRTGFLKDEDGNAVKSRLNEPLLKDIAAAGGGFFLNLRGADTAGILYDRGLAELPKVDFTARLVRQRRERFYWPLLFAMLALIVELFLPDRVKKRPPAAPSIAKGASPAPPVTAALLALLLLPALAFGSPSSARRAFEAGEYKRALEEYDRMLEKNPKDPKLNYNAGNAAFMGGLFGRAAEHFNAALTSPDLPAQQMAYYNLGNALYRQGEQTSDPAEKQKLWERALQSYDSTLQMDPKDADAQFNRELVTKKLEELKRQQEEQPPQQQQKNQDQDQKDQQKQDKQQSDQQKQQQAQKKESDQKKKNEKSAEKKQADAKQDQSQKAQAQPTKDKEKDSGKSGGKEPQEGVDPNRVQMATMTPKQAEQMLDAQRSEDKVLIFGPVNLTNKSPDRILKNW